MRIFLSIFEVILILTLFFIFSTSSVAISTIIDFMGQANLPTGLLYNNTEVGGLSGITYNPEQQVYYAISDDSSNKNKARFYTLNIDLSSGSLPETGVSVIGVTQLLTETGETFTKDSLDPEGIAFSGNSVFIASEGNFYGNIIDFIKEFSLQGKLLRSLPIPEKFRDKNWSKNQGVRSNLSLESLTITPDKNYLFTASENALIQDGEIANLDRGTPSRILRYNLQTNQPDREFLYFTDPLANSSFIAEQYDRQGLVDLLAIDQEHLISLERSFSLGLGYTIKLFLVNLEKADNIQELESIKLANSEILPVEKTLLLNLNSLNILIDNIEGLTWGSPLPEGGRSLILISDNNFMSLQTTQIIALRINPNVVSPEGL
ncbi:esterase-like activity of phytase family protein [Planktothrix agardhii]|uniref:esterase-like activity of phytase family protein n=1 Tax=Planktothrix agardhii TaxID=1160 RepID=UPI001D0B2AA3|nr:esterase-like activity of phytase family protein [Planktothrix agardhii]MCB8760334.1 esterase-like activity of phytase family protein [Planktothrix agardhii 1813]